MGVVVVSGRFMRDDWLDLIDAVAERDEMAVPVVDEHATRNDLRSAVTVVLGVAVVQLVIPKHEHHRRSKTLVRCGTLEHPQHMTIHAFADAQGQIVLALRQIAQQQK